MLLFFCCKYNLGKKAAITVLFFIFTIPFTCFCQQLINIDPVLITEENSELPSNHIHSIYFDDSNVAWIGTNAGLSQIIDKTWINYNKDNSLPGDTINDIEGTNSGSQNKLFIAMNSGIAVAYYQDKQGIDSLTNYQQSSSRLLNNTVTNLELDPNGFLWVASNYGINTFNNGFLHETLGTYSSNDDYFLFRDFQINDIKWFDSISEILVATDGAGVSRLRYNEIDGISGATTYDTYWTDIISDNARSIAVDGLTQWYATDNGLQLHTDSLPLRGWNQYYTSDSGLVNNDVITIYIDNNGTKWIATNPGLNVLIDNHIYQVKSQGGVLQSGITCISEDKSGLIWVGTTDGIQIIDPLVMVNTHRIQNYSAENINFFTYPNPVKDVLNIQLTETDQKKNIDLQIVDLSGKVCFMNSYSSRDLNTIRINISESGLKQGLWIVKLTQNRIIYCQVIQIQ